MYRRIALIASFFLGLLIIGQPAAAQLNIQSATQVHSGLSVQHGIAYAARHDVYLMVYDDRNAGGVWGRFVNAAGTAVGNAFLIGSQAGVAYANDPMVAYSHDTADDVFFVMYATDRGKGFDGPPSAWIQRVSFTGTGGALVGNAFLASQGTYEIPNDIVYNPVTQQFVAAWGRVYGGSAETDVEVRFFNANGTAASGAINVSNGSWTQNHARLAVDWETNRIMVAYEGVSPASPSPQQEILGLWGKVVDGSTGALLTGMLTVQSGFALHAVPVFLPERDGFMVAWTAFNPLRDVQARFVSSATGTVGTMPAGVYTLAGTARNEDEPMGIYDAISRKVLMAFQSSGACPNDGCAYFDGAVLDAMGAVQSGPFTGLSTAVSPTGATGTYSPDMAVGEGGQFGFSMAAGYNSNWVQRASWPAAGTPGPIFGGGGPSPNVSASPSSLSFTINKNGATISGFTPQNVGVSFGTSPVAWTATTSTPWLQVGSGSGNGNGQFSVTIINPGDVIGAQTSLNGTVTLSAPGAPNSPVTVPVSLTVAPSGGAVTILSATQVHTGLSVQHGIAYAARHDVYLMVYDDRVAGGVKGRFVNAAGATVGNAFVISSQAGIAYANDPMVAYSNDTADDVFFVMYATDRGKQFDGPPSAWIQRVSFTGTGGALVGNAFLASEGSYEIPNDIVFNPFTRKFVAAWGRVYSGNAETDVELRFFNVDGTPSGGIVNVSNGNWTQNHARLAVDWETNRIMVAYEGVSPASPSPQQEILGLWAKVVDGTTGALLTNMLTVGSGFTIHAIPVFLPERDGFMVAWTSFPVGGGRDVQARFVSSATGTVGTMPAGVYTLAGTSRSEDEPMGIYDAISRRVLMAFQSSGGCPNDTCPNFDGAVLDAMGAVQLGPFTQLSTPAATTGTYSPDMAVGEGGQFGISMAVNYAANYVQRISLSASDTPGPIFGGGTANGVALPTNLAFTIVKSGATIGGFLPQVVPVTFTGTPFAWTAASTVPWLQVTGGSGTGNGQFSVTVINPSDVIGSQTSLSGSIVVTAPGAVNSPATLPVSLAVAAGPAPADPFGQVDSPAQSATGVQGAIAITGWALDDTLVSSVTVYRNCLAFEPQGNCQLVLGNNVVLVGQAVFLQGARPDVEAAFPFYPNANRAGWGVQVLTNMLPHVPSQLMLGGQGALTLYAVATDNSGNKKLLGRSFVPSDPAFNTPTSITLANDTIAKPFGMLDTPAQGQTIGGVYAVFGWALTPDTNLINDGGDIQIPINGSTVNVYVDGLLKGPVTFNQCRGSVGNPVPAGLYCNDDIANLFGNTTPQPLNTTRTSNPTKYRNLDVQRGAIGSYVLNTNTLTNGLHTISWSVVDSAGRSEGVGSRFFTVSNGAPLSSSLTFAGAEDTSARMMATDLDSTPVGTEAVWGRTGFDPRQAWQAMPLDSAGERRVLLPEMGRLDLWLGAPVDRAYLSANGTLRALPPGSSLQGANFTWAPGPGLVGNYALVFLRGDERIDVLVTIESRTPKEGESEVRMHLDAPSTGGWTGRGVTISGWAVDPGSAIGAGVDAVHVWARRLGDDAPSSPVFLGEATLGVQRPDAARTAGARFSHAGFEFTATLTPGRYEVTAYVWNQRTARWEASRTTIVSVR